MFAEEGGTKGKAGWQQRATAPTGVGDSHLESWGEVLKDLRQEPLRSLE